MIILVYAALIGGSVTFALLWSYGFVVALLGAPFGASALVTATALYLGRRRAQIRHGQEAPIADIPREKMLKKDL